MNRYLIVTIALLLLSTACRKKETGSPQEQLPPITYTGANTFGCLIDGKLLKPKRNIGSTSIILQCNYQYFNNQHHFLLGASNTIDNYSVTFGMLGTPISGDITIHYSIPGSGQMSAGCGETIFSLMRYTYQTNPTSPGEFKIEHFDSLKQIISGTFWFDAYDTSGKVVHVTDGRFDVKFTY